jgi:sortase A
VGIAGHRTTHGAPFRNIDKLDRGDDVIVEMPYGTFVYRVEKTRIVKPSQTEVKNQVAYNRLILSACHPLYSAAERIVVFARFARREAPRVERG